MRLIVVGVDLENRSCVVSEVPILPGISTKFGSQNLWQTQGLPPELEVPRRRPEDEARVFSPVDGSGFVYAVWPPGFDSTMHRTDTLDYGVVITGDTRLRLEAGEVELRAGDCWMIPGLPHQWLAGASGTSIAVSMIGLGTSPMAAVAG